MRQPTLMRRKTLQLLSGSGHEKIDSLQQWSKRPLVVIEPGERSSRSALSLYTIGSIKEIKGIRKYLSVDGGMTDI